ncbi:hypothetical protein FHETE_2353 [Fusarium heterosporum]|uniref:Uncharacterized protein n=1 Tax=Fusarium heterosporum TaxID=42747 RepID=A0A8H5TUH7_FUSHE|nr:hypothetical protein FHETE_2353 [Fusarium heterosporum]
MKTWFLPPDFTFTPHETLPLGAIIAHPSRPSEVLASPLSDSSISLPKIQTLLETNHSHSKEASRTLGFSIFAKFAEFASGSLEYEVSHRNLVEYGTVDHRVQSLVTPFSKEFLDSLVAIQTVKDHIDSGMFGKRPVYLVTGLRVTEVPFIVTREVGSGRRIAISATVPTGTVPVGVGGGISASSEKTNKESYETAPGIVFAYRLHVIRSRSNGTAQSAMFSHRTAFWTGETESEPMEAAEATPEVVAEDIEEDVVFKRYDIEDDVCCLGAAI